MFIPLQHCARRILLTKLIWLPPSFFENLFPSVSCRKLVSWRQRGRAFSDSWLGGCRVELKISRFCRFCVVSSSVFGKTTSEFFVRSDCILPNWKKRTRELWRTFIKTSFVRVFVTLSPIVQGKERDASPDGRRNSRTKIVTFFN